MLLAASSIGAILQEHGSANAIRYICIHALGEYEMNPDPDNLMTLNHLSIMGAVYHAQGKPDMAEKTWARVLQEQMRNLDIGHEGTL